MTEEKCQWCDQSEARWSAALGIVEHYADLLGIERPDRHSPDWHRMKERITRTLRIHADLVKTAEVSRNILVHLEEK